MTDVEPANVSAYHAHIYYLPETRADAAAVRERLSARFEVQLGRWHDLPIGPHTQGMYQVLFASSLPASFPGSCSTGVGSKSWSTRTRGTTSRTTRGMRSGWVTDCHCA